MAAPTASSRPRGSVLRRKPVEAFFTDTKDPKRRLKRTLGTWDLAVMGVAVAIGAGIFSVGAKAAARNAGPAVIVSFLIAAVVCGLAIMCYAEFASTIPVAGSAYTYSYATMGEGIAWFIGWDLILEMLLAGAVIAKYWGVYLGDVFTSFGLDMSTSSTLGTVHVDWAPIAIVAAFTVLLVLGTRLSSRVNAVFTILKVAITLFVVVVGFFYVKAANYSPFVPPSQPAPPQAELDQPFFAFLTGMTPTTYGIVGVLSGAALVFFAFIGFDVVATTAEETKDPQRTMPRGILIGLGIVTVLYVLVTIVITGMVPYTELAAQEAPSLTSAFLLVGADWAGQIISIGILLGLTSVLLVLLLGLTRVVFALSRDGLLPRGLSRTGSRGTPVALQIGAGVVVAVLAGVLDVSSLEEMVNIGTLSAFVLVSFGVVVLRRTRPDLKRGFRVPWAPALPIISGVVCIALMFNLPTLTWIRFGVWLVIGAVLYFAYGFWNSRLRHGEIVSTEVDLDAPAGH